ncbi:MAG: hypothetical protein PHG63_01200 [Candidatus Dojkabacteria bacterium]|nr:hypothetical protein [Candidatus Dojkabacteria bacterium]
MKKSWHLLPKIQSGEKTVETRWYRTKRCPWDKIRKGDTIFFKDSGEPVTLKSHACSVEYMTPQTEAQRIAIMKSVIRQDLCCSHIPEDVRTYISNKRYCIIIHLTEPQPVRPFHIDKTGFGAQSAWLCLDDIRRIKRKSVRHPHTQ